MGMHSSECLVYYSVAMDGIPAFEIVRSHRRSISIHILPYGKVEVRAPHLVPAFVINRFVKDKSDWISKQVNRAKIFQPKINNKATESSEYLYLGKSYKFRIGAFKEITFTDSLNFPNFKLFRFQKELTQWYMTQAKKIITKRVAHYAAELETEYKEITYSDTTSKWGSCSRDNRLQFTWRLIMAPLLVIDYVVVHELVHTKHKNHGPAFWEEVRKYKPAYKQYIRWLKDHAAQIHSFAA